MSLQDYTRQELEAELERRNLENKKPVMLEDPDLSNLKAMLQELIDSIAKDRWLDSDDKQFVYQEAMKTFFGRDVFLWINEALG